MSTGAALTFGEDASGQLGNGIGGATSTPSPVLAGVSDVAGGREFSLALVQGIVYAWGDDTKGQLGNGTPLANAAGPVKVALPTDLAATAAATGHSTGLALMRDGTLRAWG